MLLCPKCHDMASKHVLKEPEQRKFKASPYNLKHGYANGKIHDPEETCAVLLGGNMLIGTGCFVRVDEYCLVGISLGESGVLELSVSIFNEADELILLIEKNEWITGDPAPWDLDADYQFLRLRAKKYDVLLELDAGKQPIRLTAKLMEA